MSKRNTHIGFFNTLTVVNTSMTAKYNPLTNLNHNAYMQVFHSGVGGGHKTTQRQSFCGLSNQNKSSFHKGAAARRPKWFSSDFRRPLHTKRCFSLLHSILISWSQEVGDSAFFWCFLAGQGLHHHFHLFPPVLGCRWMSRSISSSLSLVEESSVSFFLQKVDPMPVKDS